MYRFLAIVVICLVLTASISSAGGYYNNPYRSDNVVAPLKLKDEGLYNLVISIQFLNEPYDKKPYKTDGYKKFIQRMMVEWSNAALNATLNSQVSELNHLPKLKSEIESKINELANSLKVKYSLNQDVEVVFTLSNFYLVHPKD